LTAAEIRTRARITAVWTALGSPPLRRNRGRAFWRGGDGLNVTLNDNKAVWHDHARGEGGGVLDLVCLVRNCSRQDALRWLANFLGITLPRTIPEGGQNWQRERKEMREAELWATTAGALVEISVEDENIADRAALTRIAGIAQVGGQELLDEFRSWRSATPELTAAMVRAGMASNVRLQKALAAWLLERGIVVVAA
jgi:hypothetical protein